MVLKIWLSCTEVYALVQFVNRSTGMKLTKSPASVIALAAVLYGTTGCRAIEGIFKAGVWVGVVIVAALLLVGFGVSRMFARS